MWSEKITPDELKSECLRPPKKTIRSVILSGPLKEYRPVAPTFKLRKKASFSKGKFIDKFFFERYKTFFMGQ